MTNLQITNLQITNLIDNKYNRKNRKNWKKIEKKLKNKTIDGHENIVN